MSRGTTRKKRAPQSQRPSTFFILALLLGVMLVAYGFIQMIRRPMAPPAPAKKKNAVILPVNEPTRALRA
jgi:hypothetical protein